MSLNPINKNAYLTDNKFQNQIFKHILLNCCIIFITVQLAKIPVRPEGRSLPWWCRYCSTGEPEFTAGCSRPTFGIGCFWHAVLLHFRAIYRFQVWYSHPKDWNELQGVYVSNILLTRVALFEIMLLYMLNIGGSLFLVTGRPIKDRLCWNRLPWLKSTRTGSMR